MTGFVTTVYSDTADAAETGVVNIEVDQVYTYDVIFNVSTAKITNVAVDTTGTGLFNAVQDGTTNTVKITGLALGTGGKFTITAKSNEISTNVTTQIVPVNVVAKLAINESELTFYKDVAGSEAYVTSTNGSTNVVYSAKGLPAGLHMDAGGNGKIYGKATDVTAAAGVDVGITATNTVTGISITKTVKVIVLSDLSSFTLTGHENVTYDTIKEKYYVNESPVTFSLKSEGVTGGVWTSKASGDFGAVVKITTTTSGSDTIFTFTPKVGTDTKFILSGDYVVTIFHNVGGLITEQSVVIHIQAGLLFDTLPEASINVSYTGLNVVAVA